MRAVSRSVGWALFECGRQAGRSKLDCGQVVSSRADAHEGSGGGVGGGCMPWLFIRIRHGGEVVAFFFSRVAGIEAHASHRDTSVPSKEGGVMYFNPTILFIFCRFFGCFGN